MYSWALENTQRGGTVTHLQNTTWCCCQVSGTRVFVPFVIFHVGVNLRDFATAKNTKFAPFTLVLPLDNCDNQTTERRCVTSSLKTWTHSQNEICAGSTHEHTHTKELECESATSGFCCLICPISFVGAFVGIVVVERALFTNTRHLLAVVPPGCGGQRAQQGVQGGQPRLDASSPHVLKDGHRLVRLRMTRAGHVSHMTTCLF